MWLDIWDISLQSKKVNVMVRLIRRNLAFKEGWHLKKLFTALARPHIEYWHVALALYWKNALENVQRQTTKLVDIYKNLTYTKRLDTLNLPSFTYRRVRGDILRCKSTSTVAAQLSY